MYQILPKMFPLQNVITETTDATAANLFNRKLYYVTEMSVDEFRNN